MLTGEKRDRRAERHQATKAELVAAAWELCRAEGLAGLSLRDLARRVGMQAPSIYSYFASKHEIYDAMFAQGAREFVDGEPDPQKAKTPREGLRRGAHYFVDFCTADPVRYQLMFQRTIPGFEPSPETFAISVAGLQRLADFFASAGLAVPGALDLYTALFTGLTDQQISNDPGGNRWARLIDDAVDMFVAYVESRQKSTKGSPK